MDDALALAALHPERTLVTKDGVVVRGAVVEAAGTEVPGEGLFTVRRDLRNLAGEREGIAAKRGEADAEIGSLAEQVGTFAATLDAALAASGAAERAHSEAEAKTAAARTEEERAVEELRVLAEEDNALRQDLAKAGESRAEAQRLAAQRQAEMATVERTLSELETALDGARAARLASAEADAAARNGRDVLVERACSLASASAAAEERARDAARRVAELADALVEVGNRRAQALAAGEAARAAQAAAAVAAAEADRRRAGTDEAATSRREARVAAEARAAASREALDAVRRTRFEAELGLERRKADQDHLVEQCRNEFGCLPGELPVLERSEAEREMKEEDLEAALAEDVTTRSLALERLGPVNHAALEEYEVESKRLEELSGQKADLEASLAQIFETIKTINLTSSERFQEAFAAVNFNFGQVFQRLFHGGTASMHLLDEGDPLDSGLEIMAQPPGQAEPDDRPPLGRREGAHGRRAPRRDLQVQAVAVLHPRRGRRPARRGEHRPLHVAPRGAVRGDAVRPHHAQQEDDGDRAGPLRRHAGRAGSVEARQREVRLTRTFLALPCAVQPIDDRGRMVEKLLGGRYEVLGFLGRGGFASVYQVRSASLQRFEALKVLHESHGEDSEFAQRFRQEARVAASLEHPSIVKVYDFGHVEGTLWYSMQFVDGPTLSGELATRGTFDEETAARIAVPLLDALDYSHTRGVVHRDIKPDNVLLDKRGRPFLMDFGIAKTGESLVKTQTGFILGSPAYLSPEQLRGQPLDGRTDVYSLGVTLYQMLAGVIPYRTENMSALARRLTEDAPPLSGRREGIHPELERIVHRSLERDRNARYANAAEMRDDLEAFLAEVHPRTTRVRAVSSESPAPPPRPEPTPRPEPAPRPAWLWPATFALVLAVLAGGWLLTRAPAPRPAPAPVAAPAPAPVPTPYPRRRRRLFPHRPTFHASRAKLRRAPPRSRKRPRRRTPPVAPRRPRTSRRRRRSP